MDGRLSWREWQAQDGSKRQNVEVIANDVFLDSRGEGGGEGGGWSREGSEAAPAPAPVGAAAGNGGGEASGDDPEVPF